MLLVLWRGLFARKVRVALTAMAIALGVTLMAGTYILTDTIDSSFSSIFHVANQGSAVVITAKSVLGTNTPPQRSPINDEMLAKVHTVPGVAQAAGGVLAPATLLSTSGAELDPKSPAFVASELPQPFSSFSPISGRFPSRSGEVALDAATASRYGYIVGDRMVVAGNGTTSDYRIIGILHFAGSGSLGGAGVAVMTLSEAQRVAAESGRFNEINVAARSGITPNQLARRIQAVLPSDVSVLTGTQQAAQQTSNFEANLGFLQTFLLVFAYVALFVGAFIIFNTFSITVAQRTREFGLLRALGSTRHQIMNSVMAESVVLGVGGSAIGLGLGLVVAPGLDQLLKAFGVDLPTTGIVVEARTVIVSMVVGTTVTVLASLAPALRSTRVPPIAALQEGVSPEPGRLSRLALPLTIVLLAIGAFFVVEGLTGHGETLVLGVGALAVFVGIAAVSPRFVPQLAGAIGLLVAWRGITGQLARENSRRQPGRTAVTAAALMVGLALVSFVSIVAAGTKASIDRAVDDSFAGNLIIEPSQATSNQGLPSSLSHSLAEVAGVRVVTPVAFSDAAIKGIAGNVTVTGIDPTSFAQLYRVGWQQGSDRVMTSLDSSDVILTNAFAKAHHFEVGERIAVLTPSDRRLSLVVRGIATDNSRLLGALTVNRSLLQTAFGQQDDGVDFVSYATGFTNTQVEPAVRGLLSRSYPQSKALTAAQFKQNQAAQVDTLLGLIYVLLAVAIVVSLFGIVNTLVLSIYERTRELGMLRAIGFTRRQIRQMIRYESVITSLMGAIIGLVVGIVFAVVVTRALSSSGFVLSIPIGTLFLLLVLAALAGVIAAVFPARRAARLDVLTAISAE